MTTSIITACTKFIRDFFVSSKFVTCHWNRLPLEIKTFILEMVDQDERTSLVCWEWHNISKTDAHYHLLLKRYAACTSLVLFQPPQNLPPLTQVRNVYNRVMARSRAKGVYLARLMSIPHHHYSVAFLDQALCFCRMKEEIAFFEKLLPMRAFSPSLTEKQEFDLWGEDLTYLPPEIRLLTGLRELDLGENKLRELPSEMTRLTSLVRLKLSGNPLSPNNVKAICKALPSLATVVVDEADMGLIEMFRDNFPKITLVIPKVYTFKEAL